MKKTNLLIGLFSSIALLAGATSCCSTAKTLTGAEKQNVEQLTGIKFLETSLGGGASAIRRAAAVENNTTQDNSDVLKILPTVDTLLTNGTAIESTVTEKETVVDGVTYTHEEIMKYKDHELKDAQYRMVYKIVASETETEGNTDKKDEEVKKANENANTDKKQEENKNDAVETEKSETLEGLVFLSDTQYYKFDSVCEAEVEGQESETERSFTVHIDEKSYVRVEEEFEVNGNKTETEFGYSFVKDGKVEIEYSLEIENKKDELSEVDYELNGVEYEVKVDRRGNDGEIVYKVEREDKKGEAKMFFRRKVDAEGNVTFEELKDNK